MKIKDILLNEDTTCSVARFYKEASAGFDKFYNSENAKYRNKNKQYYDEHFDLWYSKEVVPVFTKPTDVPQVSYTNKPTGAAHQSPGYRGLQYALRAAGLPHNNVQNYQSRIPVATSPEMDGKTGN